MESKRFHTGDLVGADIGSYNEIYGIIINDDVFHDSVNQSYYVKVRWTDGQVTTSNTLGMVKVRENKMKREEIIGAVVDGVNDLYEERIREANSFCNNNNVGGKMRNFTGNLVQDIAKFVWEKLGELNNLQRCLAMKGEKDKKRLYSKNGYEDKQVDRHCYLDKNIKLLQECKAYLDVCYMGRASNDMRLLRKAFQKRQLPTMVVAIEDCIKKESLNFIMDDGHVDRVFFLADGKRNAKKPIWKPQFYKPLNRKKVEEYVTLLYNVQVQEN